MKRMFWISPKILICCTKKKRNCKSPLCGLDVNTFTRFAKWTFGKQLTIAMSKWRQCAEFSFFFWQNGLNFICLVACVSIFHSFWFHSTVETRYLCKHVMLFVNNWLAKAADVKISEGSCLSFRKCALIFN